MNKRMQFEWPLTVRLREGRTNGTDLRWIVSPVHIEAADEIDRVNEINADLLEALKNIVLFFDKTGFANKFLDEARAAIAKAEGKE